MMRKRFKFGFFVLKHRKQTNLWRLYATLQTFPSTLAWQSGLHNFLLPGKQVYESRFVRDW